MASRTNKKVTMEGLARMVSKGFGDMDKGFKNIDQRFKEVNVRLDRIESSILKHHAQQILMLERRMQRMEGLLTIK